MSEFEDLDEFAEHVDAWYKNQINVVEHFLDVPEGVRMEVDGVENILSGDLYRGFIIAMRLVAQDLKAHAPFIVLVDEGEVVH